MYVLLKKKDGNPFIVKKTAWERQKSKDLSARHAAYTGVEVLSESNDEKALQEKAKAFFAKKETTEVITPNKK